MARARLNTLPKSMNLGHNAETIRQGLRKRAKYFVQFKRIMALSELFIPPFGYSIDAAKGEIIKIPTLAHRYNMNLIRLITITDLLDIKKDEFNLI